ncbi:MAG TPA: tail fiber domain-containing protein [Pyrinomonadaceae bacterium]|nr:tail fiber domain-containing protein [Chloracidobacterium sp.]HRJ87513.1 tail fiber domain-containing protein [Pyrinomonadaceae bacterium]HRK50470.1 tail fiber domain-containing protein [Pyrinomonadaceae bacterium]
MKELLRTIIIAACAAAVSAQTTEFTFQGKLLDGGSPASIQYDLRFRLFDSQFGGNQVGSTLNIANVQPIAGIFTVTLDFGAASLSGEDRWIEVGISTAAANDYVTLTPRQKLLSSPFAVQALQAATSVNANFASQALDSSNLGGIAATQYVRTDDPRMADQRDPLPGSGSYIQNQSGNQQTASFEINGTGRASGFDVSTAYRILGNPVLSAPGLSNLVVGLNSGGNITSGNQNLFLGMSSGSTLNSGNRNTFAGFFSGQNTASGDDNSFFGVQSGRENTTGSRNTFNGRLSGFINSTGSDNAFFGYGAGAANTTGSNNTVVGAFASTGSNTRMFGTAIGSYATVSDDDTIVLGKSAGTYDGIPRPADTVVVPGLLNVAGSFEAPVVRAGIQFNIGVSRILHSPGSNLFVGRSTGTNFVSGSFNTIVGGTAGNSLANGSSNSFFGNSAGFQNHGSDNSFFGMAAGQLNQSGVANSFFGKEAGVANLTGNSNAFFGNGTGVGNTTGSNNTLVGSAANVAADGLSFATAIGAGASVNASNSVVLGRSADTVRVPGSLFVTSTINASSVSSFSITSNSISTSSITTGTATATTVGVGTSSPTRTLHVNGEMLSFGNQAGYFLSDRETPTSQWRLYSSGFTARLSLGGTDRLAVTPNGILSVQNLDSATSTHVCWNTSTGNFSFCSSSRRYKRDVKDFRTGLSIVRQLRPVTFDWIVSGDRDLGFIAEETAKIEPLLTFKNKDGDIEGVNYGRMSAVFVNAIKEQQEQIEIQARQIRELTRLVCSVLPSADVCSVKEEKK